MIHTSSANCGTHNANVFLIQIAKIAYCTLPWQNCTALLICMKTSFNVHCKVHITFAMSSYGAFEMYCKSGGGRGVARPSCGRTQWVSLDNTHTLATRQLPYYSTPCLPSSYGIPLRFLHNAQLQPHATSHNINGFA